MLFVVNIYSLIYHSNRNDGNVAQNNKQWNLTSIVCPTTKLFLNEISSEFCLLYNDDPFE